MDRRTRRGIFLCSQPMRFPWSFRQQRRLLWMLVLVFEELVPFFSNLNYIIYSKYRRKWITREALGSNKHNTEIKNVREWSFLSHTKWTTKNWGSINNFRPYLCIIPSLFIPFMLQLLFNLLLCCVLDIQTYTRRRHKSEIHKICSDENLFSQFN